jgi:anti-anti-sigma factor
VIVVRRGDGCSAPPFTLSTSAAGSGRPVVAVGGDLDFQTADALRTELDDLLGAAPAELTLSVGDLRFVDSTGLAVIVHAWRACQDAGVVLRVREVPRFLATMLDITGVAELLARPVRSAPNGHPATTPDVEVSGWGASGKRGRHDARGADHRGHPLRPGDGSPASAR